MEKYIKKTIKFYDKNIEEYTKNTVKLQDKNVLKKFVAYLPKKARILDLGCGFGRDCKFFIKKGFDTYGVDFSSEMIRKAKKYAKSAKFFVMDMRKLSFENEFFSGIWCSAALLHLKKKDAVKALQEIKRVLKKGGLLYLSLKSGKGEKIVKDKRYKGASKFYAYYSKKEITDLLKKNNFKIIEFEMKKSKKGAYRYTDTIYLIAKKQI